MNVNLFGKTLSELREITSGLSLPPYTAEQIADWLYKKRAGSIDEMTNLSKAARNALNEKYTIGFTEPVSVQISQDGTKKYLFGTANNRYIETAYIPEKARHTLCVSSQVGCKMGCLFCMTGRQGFQGNLTAAEILNQVVRVEESERLTNIVYMGMGEPLDNIDEVLKSLEILTSSYGFSMSPRRLTVSTIGLYPGLNRFIEESNCHLAVSLHTAFDEERRKIMPVQTVYPVADIIKTLRDYDLGKQRRISFEYIMFKKFNDDSRHISELVRLLHGMRSRINLIRFHAIPGTPLESSDDETILQFRDALNRKGITATIRASRGEDISAACGLLSTRELLQQTRQ